MRGILEESRRDELIPAVLDALLDFHLHFLRRLCHRRNEALVVDSVSDIVYSEVSAVNNVEIINSTNSNFSELTHHSICQA